MANLRALISESRIRTIASAESPQPGTLSTRLDACAENLLIASLAFMPLAFGAVEAWSELIVFIILGLAGSCFALKLMVCPNTRLRGTWLCLPVVMFLLLVALQLIPLPNSIIRAISPHTAAIKDRLLADLPNSQSLLRFKTLSFYPLATRKMLRVILAATCVFCLVLNFQYRPAQIQRLLMALTLIGGLVGLVALAQDASAAKGVYWHFATNPGYRATAGTFINYNHFSQFMNLSLGAAIALAMMLLADEGLFKGKSLDAVFRDMPTRCKATLGAISVGAILTTIAIFLSGSRGGMISLLIASGLTGILLAGSRRSSGAAWMMLSVGLIAFILILYLAFDVAAHRLQSLKNLQQASPVRWESNKDVWALWPQFPAFGIGLGNHEMVYPMFSGKPLPGLSEQLENDYLQLLEETGIVGMVCLLFFVSGVLFQLLRVIRRNSCSEDAAAFGLGFGLIAVCVHSCTDFGQRLPANACLTAVFCGLIVSLGRDRLASKSNSVERRGMKIVGLILAGLLWCWVLLGATRSALAENAWRSANLTAVDLATNRLHGNNETYTLLLQHAGAAAETGPDNITYQFWLNQYRWQSISRLRDANDQIIVTDRAQQLTRRIVEAMNRARELCPTFGPLYCAVGQLELYVLNDPVGAKHIRQGFSLAPANPLTCFAAGRLATREGRWDDAAIAFQRSMALSYPVNEIVDIYIQEADRPDLVVNLIQDDRGQLSDLADKLEKRGTRDALVRLARKRADELLVAEAESPNAGPSVLASRAAQLYQRRDDASAIEYYNRAISLDYGKSGWHYGLALALARSGKVDEATHEARICLRLAPDAVDAQKLIETLSTASSRKAHD